MTINIDNAVATASGILGMVLGLFGAIVSTWRLRQHVKISARKHIAAHSGLVGLEICVANTGDVPVSVKSVSFTLGKRGKETLAFRPLDRDGHLVRLPQVVGPRASLEVYMEPSACGGEAFLRVARPFAKTTVGRVFKGRKIRKGDLADCAARNAKHDDRDLWPSADFFDDVHFEVDL